MQLSRRGLRPGAAGTICAAATPSGVTNTPIWLPVLRPRLNTDHMRHSLDCPPLLGRRPFEPNSFNRKLISRARDRRPHCAGIELNPRRASRSENRVSLCLRLTGDATDLRRTSGWGGASRLRRPSVLCWPPPGWCWEEGASRAHRSGDAKKPSLGLGGAHPQAPTPPIDALATQPRQRSAAP